MVCRALLTEPEILLLDEPTAGMDAFARRQMWNLLKKLNQQKLTILLTTHYMEEAETLCDRVGFMCGGRLEETDAPGHMIETLGRYAVDETSPDGLQSHYFHGKEEAIQYSVRVRTGNSASQYDIGRCISGDKSGSSWNAGKNGYSYCVMGKMGRIPAGFL